MKLQDSLSHCKEECATIVKVRFCGWLNPSRVSCLQEKTTRAILSHRFIEQTQLPGRFSETRRVFVWSTWQSRHTASCQLSGRDQAVPRHLLRVSI